MKRAAFALLLAALAGCGGEEEGTARAQEAQPERQPRGSTAQLGEGAAPEGTTVQLCDGHTTTQVPTGGSANRETGQQISNDLMAQWTARNPEREWEADPNPAHAIVPGANNDGVIAQAGSQGHSNSYGGVTSLDVLTWQREQARFVAEGDRVFHDATALGSTIAVSCDMCHPHAANTHPETYPKFQVQLGRVALLRDMINWCLEHPSRAPRLDESDPRMHALEAYIINQRAGHPITPGRR